MNRQTGSKETNYTELEIARDLRVLQYSPFVEVKNIGCSVEGRNLYAIGVGTGKEKLHYTAGMHANEWLTTAILMKFCLECCFCLQNDQPLAGFELAPIFQRKSIWFTPSVNPDGAWLVQKGIEPQNLRYNDILRLNRGVAAFGHWKSNINGVDLNHQFPAEWAIQAARSPRQPRPRDYAGTKPLSEPEAQALAEFTQSMNFARVMALHSQGELIYWGYSGKEPAEAAYFARVMSQLSGYQAIRDAGSHAGYKDWFIEEFRRPGFTVEIGRGSNPLPPSDLPHIYTKVQKMLLWFAAQ